MHANQLTLSVATVRALVDEQFPQWRGLPVRSTVASGTVNAIFRIGDHLAARFPLKLRDVQSTRRWLESEADAARELVGRTRFPTPAPVAIGEPGVGYPLPWSVQTWLPGVVATRDDPGKSVAFAHDLAAFINDVRAIDTGGRTLTARAEEATYRPTTRGWKPVSVTASTSWMFRGFAESGPSCGICPAAQSRT
jgi:aminoglycoside phosphotransferase (APT) family kinase protein